MSDYQIPLELLVKHLKQHPEHIVYVYAGAGLVFILAGLVLWYFRKYFTFIFKSLSRKLAVSFEDLEDLDPGAVPAMLENKRGVLMGRDVLKRMHKKKGDRFKIMGLIYKDIDLEFEIVGELPKGRNDGTAIMNSSYLNDALDAYPRLHSGKKHPMADRSLSLLWMKIPDMHNFQKVADQVMTSSQFTDPFVKCATGS